MPPLRLLVSTHGSGLLTWVQIWIWRDSQHRSRQRGQEEDLPCPQRVSVLLLWLLQSCTRGCIGRIGEAASSSWKLKIRSYAKGSFTGRTWSHLQRLYVSSFVIKYKLCHLGHNPKNPKCHLIGNASRRCVVCFLAAWR